MDPAKQKSIEVVGHFEEIGRHGAIERLVVVGRDESQLLRTLRHFTKYPCFSISRLGRSELRVQGRSVVVRVQARDCNRENYRRIYIEER